MSRCFEFPPPGYKLSDEKIAIMMEMIKRIEEKAKKREERKERRKRRRERKEKKSGGRDDETEQSSLSEEHNLPENTKKRKRQCCYSSESNSIHQTSAYLAELLDFKDLVHKLLPPDPEDLDWLYPDRRRKEKRQIYESETISCSWPPRAQYLDQIDAYALPYTISF